MKPGNYPLILLSLPLFMFCCSAQAESTSSSVVSREQLTMTEMTARAGRVLTLFTLSQSPQKMWAGTEHGGLWQSVDAGNSWLSASAAMQNLAVAALAADPGNPGIMYAGTWDARSNQATARGQGLFKSGDGGASWALLPLTSPATVGENWSHINSIAINKTGVVLAATSDNHRNGYIYRSTDGGQTWGLLPVYAGSKVGPHNMVHKVRFDPENPDVAIFMDDYANVTRSGDGGATWNVVRKSSTSCK